MDAIGRIGFNVPNVTGAEFQHIAAAIAMRHLSGDGSYTRRCQAFLEELIGVRRALLTTSCTDALEMSALLLDLRPGDEVIVPSFTFVSTANAFVLHGATVVFADVDPVTLNIDPAAVAAAVTERTRAVVAVHYAGVACDVDALGAVCDAHGLVLVEDDAHGLGGTWRGEQLGSFGALATLSFHETKNVQCGEGGALLINDAGLVDRAEVIREKGTNRSAFFQGRVEKYTWMDVGSSYLMSDLQAAFLWAQFEAFDATTKRRTEIWDAYAEALAPWAAANGVRLPVVPDECAHPGHLFYLLLPDGPSRQAFIAHMDTAGIDTPFHYVPLHSSPGGRRYGRTAGCPVTEEVSARLVRLPLHPSLDVAIQRRIVEAVTAFSATT